jgi:hypothetical protein
MSPIKNLEGLSVEEINHELSNVAKFVVFQYCVSIILMTFKRGSDIYFKRANESTIKHSIGFILISVLFGWWGIPWGPVYTIGSLHTNLSGGMDVTAEVLRHMSAK